MKNKVVKHLKDDMKMFKSEASEDKKLIKSLKINKDDEASEKKCNGNPKSKMKKKSAKAVKVKRWQSK